MHYRGTRMVCMRRRWQRSTEYLVTFVRAARLSIFLQERRLTRRCSRPLKSAAAERQAVRLGSSLVAERVEITLASPVVAVSLESQSAAGDGPVGRLLANNFLEADMKTILLAALVLGFCG